MVGSHLADYLLENTNWKIFGVCRWRSPTDNILHLSDVINKKRIEIRYLDLCDYSSIEKVINEVKPDYVFHLVLKASQASFDQREVTYNTNV